MKQIWIIAKKEFLTLVGAPTGYIFSGLLIAVSMWIYLNDIFVGGQSTLAPLFSIMVFLFSIFIPAITMGLIADEKKNGNWELLLTLPINETQVVLGKFVGAIIFLISTMVLLVPIVVTMYVIGNPETGVLIGGLVGLFLIGSAYIATGILGSSLTNSSIVAFLATTVFLTINNFIGQGVVLDRMPEMVKEVLGYVSLAMRTINLNSGLIDPVEILFFGSWMAINLILAIMVLKAKDK